MGDYPAADFLVPTFRNAVWTLFRNVGTTDEAGTESVRKTSVHKIQMPGNHPKERISTHNTAKVSSKKIVFC